MFFKFYLLFLWLNFKIITGSYDIPGDEETDVDLLTPLENLINTDPRVYRTKGLDGLPAVGIQRGVEIVVPYRIYLPRKFYRNFAIVASIKPKDNKGGYLFAVVNAFDTVVDLGLLLSPAGRSQTNISLIYTDSQTQTSSNVISSFLVPAFTNQWTQLALEVVGDTVALYFRCMRFATRKVTRIPEQLQLDDASKLYIANAGPLLGGGFEGAIQELKLHDDPAEAANQCNEDWWKGKRKNGYIKGDEASGFDDETFNDLKSTPQNDQETNQIYDDDRGKEGIIGIQPTTVEPKVITSLVPEYVKGPKGDKGDKGDPGPPGVCSQDCSSFYSYSQSPLRLSDEDIERIANHPGVKGAKGDRGDVSPSHYYTGPTTIPPYNPNVHRFTAKGEKGEKGDRGPIGPPGQPGTVTQTGGGPGIVSVYPTSTELFASASVTPVGQLAFSVSSQQLYIRVNNGWREVKLGEFYSSVEPKPLVPITSEEFSSKDDHLAYWLNDEASIHNNHKGPCVRRSLSQVTSSVEEIRQPPRPILQPQDQIKPVEPQQKPEIQTLAPPREEPQRHHHQNYHQQQQQQQQRHEHHPRIQHRDKIIHLIALNEPLNGNMKGIRGADFQCYKQARQAGYRTTFRAFISSRVQDLLKVVHYADRESPVVNSRGERVYNSWSDIFNKTSTSHVPIYSFSGRNIYNSPEYQDQYIWHGSDESGLRVDGGYCEAWRSADSYAHGMASALLRGRPLITEAEQVSCRRELIVLCIENMSKYNIDLRLSRRMQWKHK